MLLLSAAPEIVSRVARAMKIIAVFIASAAAYSPTPHGSLSRATRSVVSQSRTRTRVPVAGFFEDMKKGFEAGQAQSSSPSPPAPPSSSTPAGPQSLFDGLKKAFNPTPLTPEELIAERLRAGEGVLWSTDYSRAWRGKNDMPQDELTLDEAKGLCKELGIPIPPEVGN